MIKTKKYKYPNLMILNEFTLSKLQEYDIDILKIRWELKTIKDFKIVVREEISDNEIYFYINRFDSGEIIEYDVNDIVNNPS